MNIVTDKTFSNTMPWTNVQVRNGGFPLDKYSIFGSYADASAYVDNPGKLAYEGLIIAATVDNKQVAYIVDSTATDGLRKVGSDPASICADISAIALTYALSAIQGLSVEEGSLSASTGKMVAQIWEENGIVKVSYRDLVIAEVSGLQTALDGKEDSGTADAKIEDLKNNYLPANYQAIGNYISSSVAEAASTEDKLVKKSTVTSEITAAIDALDVGTLTMNGFNGENFEVISSIAEVDGKIVVGKHEINLKSAIIDKITGLQNVSADHETRLTAVEGKVDGLISISSTLDTKIDNLSTSLSNTVDAKIKNITDNYALSADVTAISGSLYSKIETDAAAAKAAGELSAQAVRNTYELCAVKYDDVKGGKAAITTSNKLVTQEDIAALTGVMHFVGTTEDTNLSDGYQGKPTGIKKYQAKPEGEGKNPEQGDFVVRTDNAKEFVYVGTWSTGKWNEIGDEDLYAKKSELDAVESKVDTHIADTDVHVSTTDKESWNAKATSADVSAIANAYRGYEETRATGVESKLRTDVNAISGQVSSFSNTWKSSVDLSVSNLSAYAKGLSTDLASEIARAKAAEQALENGLSDYALSADVTAIKNALTAVDAGLRTDVNTVSTDLGTLSTSFTSYKTTNDAAVSAVDTKANGIRTDLNTVSSDLDKLESIAINSVILNGLTATVSKNVATLSIDVINCGGAE